MWRSTIVDLGSPVHVVDYGGTGPPLVLVHGLEGCALNWVGAAPLLSHNHRVVALDLAGFGITPPNGRDASVESSAELVIDFIEHLDDGSATLIGNSMGGLVSMLVAVARPDLVASMVLVDPALPVVSWRDTDGEILVKLVGPLVPLLGPNLVKLYHRTHSPQEHARESMAMVAAEPASIPEIVRVASEEVVKARRSLDWAVPSLVDADRSIATWILNRRKYAKMLHKISVPTLLVHGSEDRLVHRTAAAWVIEERPDWDYELLDGLGHVPMMEDPPAFVATVEPFLARTSGAPR
jgi:pimeloyl-ACP methyl ester carboxylesterase